MTVLTGECQHISASETKELPDALTHIAARCVEPEPLE